MNQFVARFNVVDNKNNKFEEDKNGNLPFIGKLMAGRAQSLLVNGSVFKREKYIPGKPYLCQTVETTYVDENGETHNGLEVDLMMPLGVRDLMEALEDCGAPVDLTVRSTTNAGVEEHADQESL